MSTGAEGRVLCGQCGKAYRWQSAFAGKKIRCQCQLVFVMPAQAPPDGQSVKAVAAAVAASAQGATPKPAAPPPPPPAPVVAKSEDLGLNLNDDDLKIDLEPAPTASKVATGAAAFAAKPKPATPAVNAPAPAAPGKEDDGLELNLKEDSIAPAPAPGAARKAAAPAAAAGAAKTTAAIGTAKAASAAAKGPTCPSCSAAVSASAVICVACGFNLKEGKKLATATGAAAKAPVSMAPPAPGDHRRVRAGHRGGFFERISRGWELAKVSYGIIWDHKQLLVFPMLSAVACMLVLASFMVPAWMSGAIQQISNQGKQGAKQVDLVWYAIAFAFYFCNYFVIVFFNTALTACAMKVTAGEQPTIGYGLSIAIKRLPQVAAWAFLSAVVGVILKALENHKKIGQFVAAILGSAWAVLTYFVVPVLCVEGVGPFKAVKRSISVLTDTWGEGLIGNISIGLINTLIAIPLILLCVVGVVLAAMAGSAVVLVAALTIAFIVIALYMAASSAADVVFKSLLYNFATGRNLPDDVDEDIFAAAFADDGKGALG